ncbi:MAG TPA: hypothetical protein VF602_11140 [Pedobacter sp.]|jgi:hypothetical protein
MKPTDSSQSSSYGDLIHFPGKMLESFEGVLASNPQQNPQQVADSVANLIQIPFGEKPFRTTVDFIGMGDHVQKYNEHLNDVTTGLYTNFGIAGLLSVKR